MKKIIYSLALIASIQFLITACQEENPQLGSPPTDADAEFTYTASDESDNVIQLTTTSSAFLKKWDFGNGETAEGDEVEVTYPFKGSYKVTLTVYNKGGSVSQEQTIVIEQSDLSLIKPVVITLSGGDALPEGKTWVVASSIKGHMGIGPAAASFPDWWEANPDDKSDTGLYDDTFTFQLQGFKFIQTTNGDVYLNNAQASNFPNAYDNKGDKTAPYTAPTNLTWFITSDADGKDYINLTNNGFIGYYTGVNKYEILSISENEMFIRFLDSKNSANAWYHRLFVEGYTPPPPPPPATSTLPLDFQGVKPPFNGFSGSTYDAVDNPDASGINTSTKVAKYVKGTEGFWAGIETTLSAKLDFSTKTTLRYKVYSPVAGIARFKIEAVDGSATPVEVDANITQVNQWQTLTFDFSAAASDTYNKVALFLDFANNNGGTFYLDDIEQVIPGCPDADTESVNSATGLNMTMATQSFGAFEGINAAIIANPFKTGINTSCSVNSYVKTGGCQTWSGTGYLLGQAIDFATATKKKFKLKVYAVNQVTTVTLRLEKLPWPATEPSAERTATITATGEWQELTFDFSDIIVSDPVNSPLTYKNIIVYFDRDQPCDGDVYYFDDLVQFQ